MLLAALLTLACAAAAPVKVERDAAPIDFTGFPVKREVLSALMRGRDIPNSAVLPGAVAGAVPQNPGADSDAGVLLSGALAAQRETANADSAGGGPTSPDAAGGGATNGGQGLGPGGMTNLHDATGHDMQHMAGRAEDDDEVGMDRAAKAAADRLTQHIRAPEEA